MPLSACDLPVPQSELDARALSGALTDLATSSDLEVSLKLLLLGLQVPHQAELPCLIAPRRLPPFEEHSIKRLDSHLVATRWLTCCPSACHQQRAREPSTSSSGLPLVC